MNGDKNNKFITIVIVVSFAICTFIFVFIVPFIAASIKENRIRKEIFNSLTNFEHSSKVVYYDDNTIYYNEEHAKLGDNIIIRFIDDNNIIKYNYKSKEIFLERGTDCLDLTKKIKDANYNIFVRNEFVYSKDANGSYYMYNIEADSLSNISKEEYYFERDGRKYSILLKNNSIKSIDNDTGEEINISIGTIVKDNAFSSIANFNLFKMKDYQVSDDILYIQLYYDYYEIILSYDIVSKELEIADWFKHESYEGRLRFYFFKNKYPVSLERYFMVSDYE